MGKREKAMTTITSEIIIMNPGPGTQIGLQFKALDEWAATLQNTPNNADPPLFFIGKIGTSAD